jgi:putative ABC transport system permease protein
MDTLLRDIKYGIRMLFKNPGFTIVAFLTLALGIGANTAIFSILNSILFQPLPFKTPDQLVMVLSSNTRHLRKGISASYPDFLDWQKQNTVFSQMSVSRVKSYTLTGVGDPERIEGGRVSGNFFDLLGIKPELGRSFTAEDDKPGAEKVVVIGDGLWRRRFGSDPGVVGRNITLNGESYRIIGVLPASFEFPIELQDAQIWSTISLDGELLTQRGAHYVSTLARLRPNAALKTAQTELSTIAKRLEKQYPDDNTGRVVDVKPLSEYLVQKIRPALLLLWGAVGFVLLIACTNVANLFLARSAARQKEVAIRTALGANRSRLVRQMLTESILLSLLAGTAGLFIAFWSIDAIRTIDFAGIPRLHDLQLDSAVLIFTLFISLLTGILFGLVPALKSVPDSSDALKEGGRSAAGGLHRNRIGRILVVSEVALAFVLLIGAGLLIRSFWRLQQVNPGFDSSNILTMQISLPAAKYEEAFSAINFFDQVLKRVSALPGVESAAAINYAPLGGDNSRSSFDLEKHPAPQAEQPAAEIKCDTPEYFHTMRIPILRGRAFDEHDRKDSKGVLLINNAMAHRYWPKEDPIGQRIQIGVSFYEDEPKFWEIIGIVGDTKQFSLDSDATPEFYLPHAQQPWPEMTLLIRGSSNPSSLTEAVKAQVKSVDKDQAVSMVRLMDEYVSNSVAQQRFSMVLLAIFACMALLLASIGIYGVISYSVTQRTNEMGIRMALGAQRQDVMKLVLGQGVVMISAGIAAGLFSALLLTRLMLTLLFQVSAVDPFTFIGIALLLISIALFATYIPARRATKVDPIVALRYE